MQPTQPVDSPPGPGQLQAAVSVLGGPPQTAAALAAALATAPVGSVPARIVRVERGSAQVIPLGRTQRTFPVNAADTHAVGDWCVVSGLRDGGPGTLQAVLARRTALVRHAAGAASRDQVLAADVDTVAVLVAADQPIAARALERMLVLVYGSGANPVVVATKCELPDARTLAELRDQITRVALGLPVLLVSARTGQGSDQLTGLVGPGRTLALIGASGAGKSTLGNHLVGGTEPAQSRGTPAPLRTGEVRASDSRGRHTTTWRELVCVPGGGALIDTPGLRSIGIWAGGDSVDAAYPDVGELLGTCRFADCTHTAEPGCAILAAVASGQLDPQRLAGWRALQREAAHQASRTDARLRAEQRRTWKQRSRDSRARTRP